MNESLVDPSKATHRKLRFDSLADLQEELDQLEIAMQAGRVHVAGNWTPSQILMHLAAWINYGYDGYPVATPPWFIRWFLRWQLKSMLAKGMPRNVRIPGVPGGTVGADDVPFEEALDRLRVAMERLGSGEEALYDSPAFGKMNHPDRIRLNLRHAELHLGYLSYS